MCLAEQLPKKQSTSDDETEWNQTLEICIQVKKKKSGIAV
jgi:hypothetical protein